MTTQEKLQQEQNMRQHLEHREQTQMFQIMTQTISMIAVQKWRDTVLIACVCVEQTQTQLSQQSKQNFTKASSKYSVTRQG